MEIEDIEFWMNVDLPKYDPLKLGKVTKEEIEEVQKLISWR